MTEEDMIDFKIKFERLYKLCDRYKKPAYEQMLWDDVRALVEKIK